MLYTLLANCGAGVGFALLLVVGLSFETAAASGVRGVIWSLYPGPHYLVCRPALLACLFQ